MRRRESCRIESNCVCVRNAERTKNVVSIKNGSDWLVWFRSVPLKKCDIFQLQPSLISHRMDCESFSGAAGVRTQTKLNRIHSNKTHASNNNQNYKCRHKRAANEMETCVAIIHYYNVRTTYLVMTFRFIYTVLVIQQSQGLTHAPPSRTKNLSMSPWTHTLARPHSPADWLPHADFAHPAK